MNADQVASDKFSHLLQRAEAVGADQVQDLGNTSPEALQRLLHELRMHQVELELQNEELRTTQFERELAQKNYAELYDTAPVGYMTLDEDGLILEANLTGAEMLGRDRGDLTGQRLSRFVAPEDQDAYHFYVQRLAKTDTLQRDEIKLLKADGSQFYARLHSRRVVQPGETGVQYDRIVISDITERVQAEHAQQEAHNFMAAVLDAAGALIVVVDREGYVVRFNRACEQLSGYSFEEVQGQPIWDLLLLPEERAPVKAVFEQLRAGQFPTEFENHWVARDGSRHLISWSNTALPDSEGVVQYAIGIGIDITERKQAEAEKERLFQEVSRQHEQLRALTRQLAEAQEVGRKQLARELHDRVGQNLAGLGLDLNIIRSQLAGTPFGYGPVQARLDDSLALVDQITEQIRDVMANLRPPVLDDYGLGTALRWYGDRLVERTGLPIVVQGEERLPRLAAALENALFRITQEALTNVAKHARASEVTVTLDMDDHKIRLVIADDGCGFDLTHLTDLEGSHGWGVLTMTERAEAVGARFRIESSPGQGTKVIVEVPNK